MEIRHLIIVHTFIATLLAVLLYLGLNPLISVSESTLQINCIILSVLISGTLVFTGFILEYSHTERLPFAKKILFYVILAILFIACNVGINTFILHELLEAEEWSSLLSSIPITIILALFVYSISVIIYELKSEKREEDNDDDILIEEQIKEVENSVPAIEHIAVKNGTKITVIPISEIIYLQSDGDYVMIHSTQGKFLKEQTMKSFETSLPSNKFVRVHRSNIVNIDFILQIELYEKQNQILILKNGAKVRISLNGYKALKEVLGL